MEKKKYFVCPVEEGLESDMLRIVHAANEDEAIAKYARHVLIKNKFYLEHVYTNTIEESFAEKFLGNGDGYLAHEYEDRGADPEFIPEEFEENVRSFFEERQDFADLYLDFFLHDDSRSFDAAMTKWRFPEEMLLYMCLGDITFFGDFAVLELSQIEEIQ
ncbi:MAG: hypothetical protein JSV81_00515 [Anaerolineales bacterium]|nr:MAG: hypothetical protein JSV81_00515 [Anaerolineales bacterium]